MFFSGLDFNSISAICAPAKSFLVGRTHARRQADFRPVDRVLAADNVSSLCRPLRRGAQDQTLHVPRAVSVPRVCTADVSRKSSRYRSVPARASREAVSHGDSQPRFAQHLGGCERGSGLAYLRGLRSTLDWHGPQALRRRFFWRGSEGNGLRARHDDDRPVPVGVSVGAVSQRQGGGQDAHAARFARQYPSFYPYQRRQNARGQHPRSTCAGAWGFLHRGSRLLGFRAAFSLSRSGQLLCHARQGESEGPASFSPSGGSPSRFNFGPTIVLTGFYSHKGFQTPLRRIRFKDPKTGKRLIFLTNNFALPALTITDLYRCRWQVELFFKWIKQHLRIKQFYGTSENAVKTQIWIAVSVYVLVAIVKKRLNISASLYEMLQILSLTMFEKTSLNTLLETVGAAQNDDDFSNQLNLFK